ncbi:MAG: hypothetical protein Kow0025_16820 [Thermodesulfovibrionales bacterium]
MSSGRLALMAAALAVAFFMFAPAAEPAEVEPEVEVWLPWGWGPGAGLLGVPYGWYPQCADFLEESAGLRRELAAASFDYGEELRKDRPSAERLAELEVRMIELRERIMDMAPLECGGRY